MSSRRDFLKNAALLGIAGALPSAMASASEILPAQASTPDDGLIVPKGNALKITGTFLDEISHDIPHQNWGEKEWDADFRNMKAIGIDTVIMIRCGYRKFITYPSKYLLGQAYHSASLQIIPVLD